MAKSTYYFELQKTDAVVLRNKDLADKIKDIFEKKQKQIWRSPSTQRARKPRIQGESQACAALNAWYGVVIII